MAPGERDGLVRRALRGVLSRAPGAVAVGIAGATGGPGAAALAAAPPAMEVAADVWRRRMSKRERARVVTVASLAGPLVRKRLDAGEHPRTDLGRYERGVSAEELLEGTLMKAQRAYEEKKLPYLARLFAGLLFDGAVPLPTLSQTVELAERLTYRQYVVMAVLDRNADGENPFGLATEPLKDHHGAERREATFEVFALLQVPLLQERTAETAYSEWSMGGAAPRFGAGGPQVVVPAYTAPSVVGTAFVEALGLRDMPMAEMLPVVQALGGLLD